MSDDWMAEGRGAQAASRQEDAATRDAESSERKDITPPGVDELHPGQAVDVLLAEVGTFHAELARVAPADGAPDERLDAPERRSPEEIVGDVLITAHSAAERIIARARDKAAEIEAAARRNVLPIVVDAERVLEEARRLHGEARATAAQARVQAKDMMEQARREAEEVAEGACAEAERRRVELELANMRLETAIKGLRSEWVGRAAEALARLEGVGLDADQEPEDGTAGSGTAADLISGGVSDDLHARLPAADVTERGRSELPRS